MLMNEPYQILKRIPYEMMNFVDARERNCYFVGKTSFIPALEATVPFCFCLVIGYSEKIYQDSLT